MPIVVVGINFLIDKLESKIFEWGGKAVRTAVEEKLVVAFQTAKDKILKYYRKTNWVYTAVLILDPRHKLETFDMTGWGRELKATSNQKFEDIYKVYFYQSEGQRSKEKEVEERRDPGSSEMSEFVIDFDALYATKPTPAEGEWMQELQKIIQCLDVTKTRTYYSGGKLTLLNFPF